MKTIYKYELEITNKQLVNLPKYFEPLCIKNQYGTPVLYCEINKEEIAKTDEEIFCFGTGHDINNHQDLRYIDTVIIGHFVWHFYIKEF